MENIRKTRKNLLKLGKTCDFNFDRQKTNKKLMKKGYMSKRTMVKEPEVKSLFGFTNKQNKLYRPGEVVVESNRLRLFRTCFIEWVS